MPDRGQVIPLGGKSRVFFALWPDPAARARLHAESLGLHQQLGGRVTHPDTLHLTLVFIGDVENDRVDDLRVAASRVKAGAFELCFDKVECWSHNHIAHLAVSKAPDDLFELVRQLTGHLRDTGIPFDARRYTPHLTLLRKADCNRWTSSRNENPAQGPICWLARDFVLVKSSLRPGGARYEQLGCWPLL
jgi:2'-5' RNA ligase